MKKPEDDLKTDPLIPEWEEFDLKVRAWAWRAVAALLIIFWGTVLWFMVTKI